MKSLVKVLMVLALGMVILMPGMAMADTLVFDDVTDGVLQSPPYTAAPLPTNYAGFSWSSTTTNGYWGVLDNASYRTEIPNVISWNNNFDFPSNPNVVLNEDGNVGASQVTLARATPFNLISAYFSDWTQNSNQNFFGASSLTLTGYLNNVQVGSVTFNLAPGPLQLQDINLFGVDRVTFDATSGGNGYYFLMDNMVYTPIPPSALLLGSGLLGLVGLGWRRRKINT